MSTIYIVHSRAGRIRIMTLTDPNTPPLPSPRKWKDNDGGDDRPLIAKLLFPVPPSPPSAGSTRLSSSPMRIIIVSLCSKVLPCCRGLFSTTCIKRTWANWSLLYIVAAATSSVFFWGKNFFWVARKEASIWRRFLSVNSFVRHGNEWARHSWRLGLAGVLRGLGCNHERHLPHPGWTKNTCCYNRRQILHLLGRHRHGSTIPPLVGHASNSVEGISPPPIIVLIDDMGKGNTIVKA